MVEVIAVAAGLVEQADRGADLPRGAESALVAVMVEEAALHRVQVVG